MFVYNYSFLQYCNLPDDDRFEFDLLIKESSEFKDAVDLFGIGDFTELSFGQVKDVQHTFNAGNVTYKDLFETFELLTGKRLKELHRLSMLDITKFSNYIIEEIKRINLIESKTLSHHITVEEEQAGVDNFNKLGTYMQFRALTKGDVTKFEQVRNIKYNICLLELIAQKESADYNERLTEIYKRKNKTNG